MSITHQIDYSWSNGSRSIPKSVPIVGSAENNFDATVPNAATNQPQTFAMTVAGMAEVFLLSNVNVTIKTNSTSSPGNTINLLANFPLIWQTGGYNSNPFTVDVTVLYLTNSSGQQAQVKGRFLAP